MIRAVVGVVVSLLVCLGGRRAHALTTSGSVAGVVLGTVAITAGWSWGFLLLSLFASVTLLSRVRAAEKAKRVGVILEKGAERDAAQIIANGAVFTAAALASLIAPATGWYAIGAGALAFSAADTWATEIGILSPGDPYSIIGGRVPVGTSGGISLIGTLGAIGGALFVAMEAMFAAWPVSFAGVVLGGVIAALADSFIGATLQERRWCDRCMTSTERTIHDCGTKTRINGGIRGLDNDTVNAACSAIGALIALVV
ncbi:MAG: DUF92 domain-containing protein [Gemmatimonadaceae bacterium]